jgi:hypothetical protein
MTFRIFDLAKRLNEDQVPSDRLEILAAPRSHKKALRLSVFAVAS